MKKEGSVRVILNERRPNISESIAFELLQKTANEIKVLQL